MKDITPLIAAEKKVLESYGNGGFKVSGEKLSHNIILMPDSVHKLEVVTIEEIDEGKLKPLFDNASNIEVLLVGGGEGAYFFSTELEQKIQKKNIAVEYMSTGAAARTYNVLLSEERKVACVLIAV